MNAADQMAALEHILATLPSAPHRVLTDDQIRAEDYWHGVAEARADEARAPMGRGDEGRRQAAYDDFIERESA
jgi:hypothetical protein